MAILNKAQEEVGNNVSSAAAIQASQPGQVVGTPQRQAIQQVQAGATNSSNVSRPVPSAGSVDAIKNPAPSPAKKIQLILMADGRYKDKDGTILPDAYVQTLLAKSNVISRTGQKQPGGLPRQAQDVNDQSQRGSQMTAQQQGQQQVIQTQQGGQIIQQKILHPQQRMQMSQAQGIQQNVVYQQAQQQGVGMAQQPHQQRVITAAPQQPQTQQVIQQQQLLQQQGQRQMILPQQQQQQQTLQQQRAQQQRLQQQLQGNQQLQLTSTAGNTVISQSPGNQYVQNNQQMVQIIPQQKPTTYNRQPQTLIRSTLNQPLQAQQVRTVQGIQAPYQKQSPTVIQLPQGGQTIQTASQNGPVLQYVATMPPDAQGQTVQRAQPNVIRRQKPTKKQQRDAMLAAGDQPGVQYVQNVSSPGLQQQHIVGQNAQYKQVLSGNQIVHQGNTGQIVTTGVGHVPQTVVSAHGSMAGVQSGLSQIAAAYDTNTPQGSPSQPLTHSGLIQGQQQPQVTMASALLAKRQNLQGGTVLAGPDDDSPPSTPVRPGLTAHSQQGMLRTVTAPGQMVRGRTPGATSKGSTSVCLPDGTDVTNNLKALPAGTSVLVKRHDGAQLQAMWNGTNITLSSSHTMQGNNSLCLLCYGSVMFFSVPIDVVC